MHTPSLQLGPGVRMPWRESVGTPFNLQSSGASENQTADEFSSDAQNENFENVMAFVHDLETQNFTDSQSVSVDAAERDALDSEGWSRGDLPELSEGDQMIDNSNGLELRRSATEFLGRHAVTDSTPSEPCQSSEVFSTIVAHSIAVQTPVSLPAMPWETGPMRSIFIIL